jgi:hypothetical protein
MMMVEVKPGTRLGSTTCETQVLVVKGGPAEIDLRCGGAAMVPVADAAVTGSPVAPFDQGTLIGKRYGDDEAGIEVLCTKAGAGSVSIGDKILVIRGAKPLPASD